MNGDFRPSCKTNQTPRFALSSPVEILVLPTNPENDHIPDFKGTLRRVLHEDHVSSAQDRVHGLTLDDENRLRGLRNGLQGFETKEERTDQDQNKSRKCLQHHSQLGVVHILSHFSFFPQKIANSDLVMQCGGTAGRAISNSDSISRPEKCLHVLRFVCPIVRRQTEATITLPVLSFPVFDLRGRVANEDWPSISKVVSAIREGQGERQCSGLDSTRRLPCLLGNLKRLPFRFSG